MPAHHPLVVVRRAKVEPSAPTSSEPVRGVKAEAGDDSGAASDADAPTSDSRKRGSEQRHGGGVLRLLVLRYQQGVVLVLLLGLGCCCCCCCRCFLFLSSSRLLLLRRRRRSVAGAPTSSSSTSPIVRLFPRRRRRGAHVGQVAHSEGHVADGLLGEDRRGAGVAAGSFFVFCLEEEEEGEERKS